MTASESVDELDRRVIAALQVDGRASWRHIASVLREPERTVARRGTSLIERGLVVITGLGITGAAMSLGRLRCSPGTVRVAAANIAARTDTTFAYVTTGLADCVAEFTPPPARLANLVLDELPGTPGLQESSMLPILRYYRAVHEWQPGILSSQEVNALQEFAPPTPQATASRADLDRTDQRLIRAIFEDGRRSHDELARLVGVSEPTARRRLDWLRRQGVLFIRAVAEPALLGLHVEALLWVKTPPRQVDVVGERLLESPHVRYCAAIMGEHQLLVDVTLPDQQALHGFITHETWLDGADSVETSLVIDAFKRSSITSTVQRGPGGTSS